MYTAGCTCPASGPCLSAKHEVMVLAALRHHNVQDLSPGDMSRDGLWTNFYFWLNNRADQIRKGFQYLFRSAKSWEHPSKPVDEYQHWKLHELVDLPKGNDMQLKIMALTTEMLTKMGWVSLLQLDNGTLQQHGQEEQRSGENKLFVGISGGGWRAFSGHCGIFRALSSKNILRMVHMFSSVSGGSWFLTKLAFDERFAAKVLRDDEHITEVVLEWMERDYFPAIRNSTPLRKESQNITHADITGDFLSTIISQVAEPIKNALGMTSAIVAAKNAITFPGKSSSKNLCWETALSTTNLCPTPPLQLTLVTNLETRRSLSTGTSYTNGTIQTTRLAQNGFYSDGMVNTSSTLCIRAQCTDIFVMTTSILRSKCRESRWVDCLTCATGKATSSATTTMME